MLQLNDKKKIIILATLILLVVIIILFFVFKKDKLATIKQSPTENPIPVREMTRDEKIDLTIDPNTSAEVYEPEGQYIYKIK